MISNKITILFGIILISAVGYTGGARILSVYSILSRSHFIIAEALLKELAKSGHNVTVISLYPPSKPIPNYRHIDFKYKHPEIDDLMKQYIDNSGDMWFTIKSMSRLVDISFGYTKELLNMPEIPDLMKEEFDLLIYEGMIGDVYLGLAAHFKCPSIAINSFQATKYFNDLVGNPTPESYVPSFIMGVNGPMTFIQRVISYLANCFLMRSMDPSLLENIYNEKFPPSKYPSFNEMRKNVSLAFVNYHFTQGNPRPYVPALVEVGGIQVKEVPDPLPDDINNWIDGAEYGVVYLSFGSNVRTNDLSPEKLKHISNTFRKLKQRVIWKFDNDSISGLPSNVKVWKWLPQDDLLAHPNLKLFITHGGLGSVLEARVRGIPLVGIPIFADQMGNLETCEKEGWAVVLHYNDLTEETFTDAIVEALNNPKYRDTVQSLSKLFLDRPMSPMKTAIFWVEYVLRHRGAKHMQAHSVQLNWFALHSYDVVGFLFLVIVVSFLILFYSVRFFIYQIFFKKIKNKSD